MTDAEYILDMIDETFAGVPAIKAHHDRIRAIADRLDKADTTPAPGVPGIAAEGNKWPFNPQYGEDWKDGTPQQAQQPAEASELPPLPPRLWVGVNPRAPLMRAVATWMEAPQGAEARAAGDVIDNELDKLLTNYARAALAQQVGAGDSERLDWLVGNLSDRDFREMGLSYRHGDKDVRKSIDAARSATRSDGGERG